METYKRFIYCFMILSLKLNDKRRTNYFWVKNCFKGVENLQILSFQFLQILLTKQLTWDENLIIVDIEVNALSSLNFVLTKVYRTKVYRTQPIEWDLEKPKQPIREVGKFKHCAIRKTFLFCFTIYTKRTCSQLKKMVRSALKA